jgi:hypothetical protein
VVALVGLVAGTVLAREISTAAPRGATYIPPPPGPVVLTSNVAFGTVTLNGKPLTGVPPLVLPLVNGQNVITFTAQPFAPRTCRVRQVRPGQVDGDCLWRSLEHIIFSIGGRVVVRPSVAVIVRFTGNDLPPDLYAAARVVVARQLAAASGSALDVPAGEPIATGGEWPNYIVSHRAGGGVRGTLSYGLFDDGASVQRTSDCGLSLCGDTLFYTTESASRASAWNVSPDAYYVWTFRDGAGNQESSLPYPLSPPPTLPLRYDAVRGWQPLDVNSDSRLPFLDLADSLDGGICGAGLFLLTAMVQQRNDYASTQRRLGAVGCAYSLHTPTLGSDGNFIWRFGVLLAADLDAHGNLPALPIATPAEIAEVGG